MELGQGILNFESLSYTLLHKLADRNMRAPAHTQIIYSQGQWQGQCLQINTSKLNHNDFHINSKRVSILLCYFCRHMLHEIVQPITGIKDR